ncbi:methyltransferase, FkbM family [Ectothiorhodosinus mongolicus]|uniref:Methyltransferase, FkbM family n=1 Tax=Ectothiorhodosinus mongolicus TaxID=233100 RepID=A0A1R3VTX1_9GAMM|nr:FkbM family methyltransferase [Ectothiorhodosinus mongolicus]ULX56790.1 SAM-dependent methyltransferase [Ectothiorhodosinus mongolicus]SIT68328.1 methyltransferase, FkbM family [Ectothiorhodosinus mongolicus]
MIIEKIKKIMPKVVKAPLKHLHACATYDPWFERSWSQEGEDQILRRIFKRREVGFYVDVGAHHPKRFSNTYLFYKRGWHGINIDAMPGSMKLFDNARPRDINLEMGIGSNAGNLDYYVFNEPALNGFSKELSEKRHEADTTDQVREVIKVDVRPLSQVLDCHLSSGQEIDFMSVDVEGLDFDVLKSNDWSRYRPKFVLAEILGSSLHEIEQTEIGQFMHDQNYMLYAKCMNTVFFKDSLLKWKTTPTGAAP